MYNDLLEAIEASKHGGDEEPDSGGGDGPGEADPVATAEAQLGDDDRPVALPEHCGALPQTLAQRLFCIIIHFLHFSSVCFARGGSGRLTLGTPACAPGDTSKMYLDRGEEPQRRKGAGNNAHIHPSSVYAAAKPSFAALAQHYPGLSPHVKVAQVCAAPPPSQLSAAPSCHPVELAELAAAAAERCHARWAALPGRAGKPGLQELRGDTRADALSAAQRPPGTPPSPTILAPPHPHTHPHMRLPKAHPPCLPFTHQAGDPFSANGKMVRCSWTGGSRTGS